MARHIRAAPRPRWRKIRALLTGGLVLGIGATMTLATWNDSEYASGSFTTSQFDIQGSVDGTTFTDHTTSGAAATMTFAAPAISPGTSVYAPFYVRTKPGSISGTLALSAGSATGGLLGPALLYRVVLFTGTCAAASFTGSPTWVIGSSGGVALTTVPSTTQAVAANSTANVQMCFEVTLPLGSANNLQGLSTTVTWQVVGTSSS